MQSAPWGRNQPTGFPARSPRGPADEDVAVVPDEVVDETQIRCCGCAVAEYTNTIEPVNFSPGLPRTAADGDMRIADRDDNVQEGAGVSDFDDVCDPPAQQAMAPVVENTPQQVVRAQPPQENVLGCCNLCNGEWVADPIEILFHTFWCCYCICCGVGTSEDSENNGSMFCKCTCCSVALSCAPAEAHGADVDDDGFDDGMCGYVHTVCCCSNYMQFPKRTGTPLCVCCGAVFDHFSMEPQQHVKDTKPNYWDFLLYQSCALCYAYCCGCTCHKVFMECYQSYTKCLGCLCRFQVTHDCCCEDAPWCSQVGILWSGRTQCQFPPIHPREGNPLFSLCGMRLRKKPKKLPVEEEEDAPEPPPPGVVPVSAT